MHTRNTHETHANTHSQEAVEDTVSSRGGAVLLQERQLKSGLHEVLRLTVCIPFLWGVPPEVEALRCDMIVCAVSVEGWNRACTKCCG